jgi:hypothetical protein
MKMGRRPSCGRGIVTYRFRYAPLLVRPWPDRRPILSATKAILFMGQDTGYTHESGTLMFPALSAEPTIPEAKRRIFSSSNSLRPSIPVTAPS